MILYCLSEEASDALNMQHVLFLFLFLYQVNDALPLEGKH